MRKINLTVVHVGLGILLECDNDAFDNKRTCLYAARDDDNVPVRQFLTETVLVMMCKE